MDTHELIQLLGEGTVQTLIMTLVGTLLSYIIGLPVGVSLIVTGPNGIKPVMSRVSGSICAPPCVHVRIVPWKRRAVKPQARTDFLYFFRSTADRIQIQFRVLK